MIESITVHLATCDCCNESQNYNQEYSVSFVNEIDLVNELKKTGWTINYNNELICPNCLDKIKNNDDV